MQISKYHVVAGDRKRKDACFCDSYNRAAPEERGEAEEDAGEDDSREEREEAFRSAPVSEL